MTKKAQKKQAGVHIENCTFHGAQQSSEADIKRYEAVRAIADALGKAADAMAGPNNNAGLVIKSGD